MKFFSIQGKEKNINVVKYIVDWDAPCRSVFQFKIKKFFKKYWKNKFVCEEFVIPGSKLSLDLLNITDKIAVECQGQQHLQYNKFFHNNSTFNYLNQIHRDCKKYNWCVANGFTFVEINEGEEKNITAQWVFDKYSIKL